MSWLERLGHERTEKARPSTDKPGRVSDFPTPLVRASPGMAVLFDELKGDAGQSVLDLGPASESHLELYRRFARRIRFVDLLTSPTPGAAWAQALEGIPPDPLRYRVVLLWDLLDRLWPEARPALIERLDDLTGGGARLYVVVDASGEPTVRPHRFTLLAPDRVRQEVVGPPMPAHDPLLPAQVERLLSPFEVVRAFTLRGGLREYVAMKRE